MSPRGSRTGPARDFPTLVVVGCVLATIGCGGPLHEGLTGVGDAGRLGFSLQFTPEPAVGAFELRVDVTRPDFSPDGPVGGCRFDVVMPSHGHEAAGKAAVTVDGTTCTLRGLSFQMPGAWRVRVVADTYYGEDEATFAVEVP